MGGGYSPRIYDIVEAHCNTFRVAKNIWFWPKKPPISKYHDLDSLHK
jgi:hypothetical protein